MTEPTVLLDVDDGVARLTLNRPAVLNAIDGEMLAALRDAVAGLSKRADVRVLVITGNGRAFCAGADLRDDMMNLEAPPQERGRRLATAFDNGLNALMRELHAFNRPKIAAVNGAAVGGGAGLALVADVTLAARSAYFAAPFTLQLGLVPDMGASWQLARRLGRTRALGFALLGERLPAETAAEWGLIWRCLPDDALMPAALDIARRLRAGPPAALAALSGCIDAAMANGFSEQLDVERDLQASLVETEDFAEGVRAFREKRPARFNGD
jgi:2-(1,2-epoxy-1,2-dihydrophenyl)acetyl-CoA isomerase